MTKVIVTGAAGYIGGTICIELKRKGYTVVGIDRRPLPDNLTEYCDSFIECDFVDFDSLAQIKEQPLAVIHCAGTSLVGPSIANPEEYYNNNVSKTLKYISFIKAHSPDTKFIFSSSASVYGDPLVSNLIDETFPTKPISPYGESKLMTEMMLKSFNQAYGLKYVSFRYFNACGAVANGIHGQEPDATHIFARLFNALENKEPFMLYGNDYPTEDGSCVRDYIHVTDIANAHILAIEKDITGIYNIGSDKGYSNLEIISAVRRWCKHIGSISVDNTARREGDPAYLIANPNKLKNNTGWIAENNLQNIIKDLYDWYSSANYAKRPKAIIPL